MLSLDKYVFVPDQGSELNQGCAGLNQGSAAQMLNRGNQLPNQGSEAIKPPLDDNVCVLGLTLDEAVDICSLVA